MLLVMIEGFSIAEDVLLVLKPTEALKCGQRYPDICDGLFFGSWQTPLMGFSYGPPTMDLSAKDPGTGFGIEPYDAWEDIELILKYVL